MMFTLDLVAGSGSEVEWPRALMIGWLAIALVLSVIEVVWLKGGFSSEKLSPVTTFCSDPLQAIRRETTSYDATG